MATLILTAAVGTTGATGFGAFVAGVAAAAAGAYIDSRWVYPALFPPPDVKGPRLDDHQFMRSGEGAALSRVYGEGVRVPGLPIWMQPLQETGREDGGGKGGSAGGAKIITHSYSLSVAVAVCATGGEPIDGIRQILANGRPVYHAARPDIEWTTSSVFMDAVNYESPYGTAGFGWRSMTLQVLLTDEPQPALLQLITDTTNRVTMTGWVNGGNNVALHVWKVRLKPARTEVVLGEIILPEDAGTKPEFVSEPTKGPTVTFVQPQDDLNAGLVDSITFYLGDSAQAVDPVIDALEDDTPAYRNAAYVVFENLQLERFNNVLPQFSFIAGRHGSGLASQTLYEILSESGLPDEAIDVGGAAGALDGYAALGVLDAARALQPVMLAADVTAQELEGRLRFFSRTTAVSSAIPATDLAARPGMRNVSRTGQVLDRGRYVLPESLVLTYIDAGAAYQQGSVRIRRPAAVGSPWRDRRQTTRETREVSVPAVLSDENARKVAERLLHSEWTNARSIALTLPPEYITIREGDRLTFTAFGQSWTVLVQKAEIGANSLVNVSAVREDDAALVFDYAPADGGQDDDRGYYTPPALMVTVPHLPALSPFRLSEFGFYHCVTTGSTQWFGAAYAEQTSSTEWKGLDPYTTLATAGWTQTALGGDKENSPHWDRTNTVRVFVLQGTLESLSEAAVLNGSNMCAIGSDGEGWEVLGFATATLVSEGLYDLTVLLRGLRDTWREQGAHSSANVNFVMLDNAVRFRTSASWAQWRTRRYRAVPDGATADTDHEYVVTPQARCKRPFAPVHLDATRLENDDVYLEWIRQTRAFISPLRINDAPELEEKQYYVLFIRATENGSILRTIVTGVGLGEAIIYSVAQQAQDGVDDAAFYWSVCQGSFAYVHEDGLTHGTESHRIQVPVTAGGGGT